MCGRVIQSSGPLRLAIVDGLDVSDSQFGNVPRRYNAAPSEELLVIRQNHKIGQRSLDLLIRSAAQKAMFLSTLQASDRSTLNPPRSSTRSLLARFERRTKWR
jgi:putative SOS response-associated peptidase YedK